MMERITLIVATLAIFAACSRQSSRHFTMQEAIMRDDKIALTQLLSSNANTINQPVNGSTPLQLAAEYGMTQTAELLLDHGAEIDQADAQGDTALGLAAGNGHVDMVKILLAHGATADWEKNFKGNASPLGGHRRLSGSGGPVVKGWRITKHWK